MQVPNHRTPGQLAAEEWDNAIRQVNTSGWRQMGGQVYLDAGHPCPLPVIAPHTFPTILDVILSYSIPQFKPRYWPPPAPGGRLYTIARWDVNMQHVMQRFSRMLNTPYNPSELGPGWTRFTCTLQHFVPSYTTYFRGEAALVSRLDATVHFELARLFQYMARLDEARGKGSFWVAGGSAIYPDVGSGCKLKGTYLPDRCAKKDNISYPENVAGYLFGDVKTSYKFSARWRDRAVAETGPTQSSTTFEYKKVIAQVKHYMREVGRDRRYKSYACQYGFVETDEEVVLLRYNPTRGPNSIEVSDGFPWRGQHHGINGMLALVYIHLLASLDHTQADGYLARD